MNIQLQVGVKVLLNNPEGKYLLLRRAVDPTATQKTFQGRWDMPGGLVHRGEASMCLEATDLL
ncbi:MAG TPA: NUDIX domain-containing protein [Candidatus Paceibacterota bacterium]|nr:NUDIX domain-containing protein [Candidatus Paceibacterota bacterium]